MSKKKKKVKERNPGRRRREEKKRITLGTSTATTTTPTDQSDSVRAPVEPPWRHPRPSPAWRLPATFECPRSRSLSRCGGSRGEEQQGHERGIQRCRRFQLMRSTSSSVTLSFPFQKTRKKNSDDPRAFYALLVERTEELLPYVYTPTVGEVSKEKNREAERPIKGGRSKRRGRDPRSLIGNATSTPPPKTGLPKLPPPPDRDFGPLPDSGRHPR